MYISSYYFLIYRLYNILQWQVNLVIMRHWLNEYSPENPSFDSQKMDFTWLLEACSFTHSNTLSFYNILVEIYTYMLHYCCFRFPELKVTPLASCWQSSKCWEQTDQHCLIGLYSRSGLRSFYGYFEMFWKLFAAVGHPRVAFAICYQTGKAIWPWVENATNIFR